MSEWTIPTDVCMQEFKFPHLNYAQIKNSADRIASRHAYRLEQYRQERAMRPPTFCSLLVNRLAGATTKTKIICSSNPRRRVKLLNQRTGQKYELVETAGRFDQSNGLSGSAFAHIWKKTSRDEHGRIIAGAQLARYFNLTLCDHRGGDSIKSLLLSSDRYRKRKLPQWHPKLPAAMAASIKSIDLRAAKRRRMEEIKEGDSDADADIEDSGEGSDIDAAERDEMEVERHLIAAMTKESQFRRTKKRLRKI